MGLLSWLVTGCAHKRWLLLMLMMLLLLLMMMIMLMMMMMMPPLDVLCAACVVLCGQLRSAQLNPHKATTHHVLGEWAYGVASISWVERRVAAALFATPPTVCWPVC